MATATAKDAARKLRMQYWNDGMGNIAFPIDPWEIAERLGIAVRPAMLDNNLAGFIVREQADGPTEIYVNESDHPVRQRFTLAHEIGHYIRHQDDPEPMGFVDERAELASSGTDPEEIWANQFAAELLMPAAIVKKWWAEGLSIGDLRRKFNVSTPAMNNRLAGLGLLGR
ncbi:ImmA/IrrE family metallo-endopeptidase [Rhodococcus sp. PvR099]|jgi:Zn-dependent peptidase ImmA (M78 family)|uniref:ImmA/IrrE family metallo-endopeptidase n=1 Tax=Rhodococcus sp. PvR099 TaxID=2806602 RepID=UPI001AE9E7D9|nr:ImmA/IrrE family metallo-endopeptidase [Rhodococcus sp. PvR099]MBP1161163.1 Zn-dependent peptidase ImmA (M78 family) [Rhodococcus sp. PvR099]